MKTRKSEKPVRTTDKEALKVLEKKIELAWVEFKTTLAAVVTNLQAAGDRVAWLLDNDPDARGKFKDLGISLHQVARLERIGRGRLLAELASKTTLFDHIPVKDQNTILHNKIPAVFQKKTGGYEVKQVDLLKEDSLVQNRVIGEKGIRSTEEQKEYIKGCVRPTWTKTAASWRINKKLGKVVFTANSSYDVEQLRFILEQLVAAIAAKPGANVDAVPK